MQVSNARKSRRVATAILGAIGAVGLVFGVVAPASAASSVSVTPNSTSGTSASVTVTINDSVDGAVYTIGFCSTETFGGIPACTYIADDIEGTGGTLNVGGTVTKTFLNEHRFIPGIGQPTNYTCEASNCQVLVVEDHDGTSGVTNYPAAFTFN